MTKRQRLIHDLVIQVRASGRTDQYVAACEILDNRNLPLGRVYDELGYDFRPAAGKRFWSEVLEKTASR